MNRSRRGPGAKPGPFAIHKNSNTWKNCDVPNCRHCKMGHSDKIPELGKMSTEAFMQNCRSCKNE